MRRLWTLVLVCFIKSMTAQEDLAKNGTASQSTNFETHYASLAITGGPTHEWSTKSCSATNSRLKVSWWMLAFPSTTVFISNVIIYYRSDNPSRLAGYYLFVSNTSISSTASSPPNDGHLCYHHDGNRLPSILQNVTCGQLGKNVIIYNERKTGVKYPTTYSDVALLELCDVQVIGCYKSWWGGGCRKPCPAYCIDRHCDPTHGTCIWGCSNNQCLNNDCYNDGKCVSGCVKGQGGLICSRKNLATDQVILKSESPNQLETQIVDGDKTNSSYLTLIGADAWVQIDTGQLHVIQSINVIFKDALTLHEYSIFVSNTSGNRPKALNVTNNVVMYMYPFQTYVHILNPVVVGRYVILSNVISSLEICEIEILGCQPGFYGDSCDTQCPRNCDGPCNPENGYCIFGCKDGYIGLICDQACTPPRFGRLCSETCHCVNQPCYFISGTCPPGGCIERWTGTSCSEDEITCRADNITRNVKYLPTKAFLYLNQNITFYCASGSYGTSVVSTCRENKQFIPPPPMCTDKTSSASAGVSLSVFVSTIAVITVIYTVAIVILLTFYRKNRTKKPGKKYEDIHIYSTCTSNINNEVNVNTYELG